MLEQYALEVGHRDRRVRRRCPFRRGEGTTLNALSICLQKANRVDVAVTISREAVTIHRNIGYRHGEGLALSNLASAV